jgi:LPS-assembly lipoprotein
MGGDLQGEGAAVKGAAVRMVIGVLLVTLLSACGFRLRGTASLPHETLYISGPAYSAFANDLKRAILSGTNTRLADDASNADATLFVLGENRAKVILTLTSQGTVREFQLRYGVSYRLADKAGKELVQPTEIVVLRSYVFNDQQALAAEAEEAVLYRDMQEDAVQQLLRRLSSPADRPPAAAPRI